MRTTGRLVRAAGLLCLALALGCGGAGDETAGQPAREAPSAERAVAADLGEVDGELAERGEALFQAKGCNACHRIGGGRLVGPDLAGVTKRRSRAFIVGIIVNPDSMLANNADAKQMLAEYFTPMANQGVTRDDALALFEYLREADEGEEGEGEEHESEEGESE